jgi:CDP-diacylglycerol--serine O-phosphatidyltransferase
VRIVKRIPGRKKRLRTVYLLPSLLTAGNMVCGLLSIQRTFEGKYDEAAWLVLLAIVFDGLDGKIAKLAKAVSLFGINFDSLADLTSFGIAPAVLMYNLPYPSQARLPIFIIFSLCSALRLARYNVQAAQEMRGDFTGLPTPAAAAVVSSGYLLLQRIGVEEQVAIFAQRWVYFGLHILALLLAVLMVSRVRFPNPSHLRIEGRKPFNYLVAAVILIAVAVWEWKIAVFLAAWGYLVFGLLSYLLRLRNARREDNLDEEDVAAEGGASSSS